MNEDKISVCFRNNAVDHSRLVPLLRCRREATEHLVLLRGRLGPLREHLREAGRTRRNERRGADAELRSTGKSWCAVPQRVCECSFLYTLPQFAVIRSIFLA